MRFTTMHISAPVRGVPMVEEPVAVYAWRGPAPVPSSGLDPSSLFREDRGHDWDWRGYLFAYHGVFGRPGDRGTIVIVYDETPSTVTCSEGHVVPDYATFCPSCGVRIHGP